jgi:crotonobetainyl-CoA:carnitine CoA-transferase CaiB-like acyl-CoA transferase
VTTLSRNDIYTSLLNLAGLGGHDGTISLGEGVTVLPSSFRVTDAATALVGAVCAAVAQLEVQQTGSPIPAVAVDPVEACVAFQSERHLQLPEPAALWDDLAGHYATADGFVQFHTNFPHHRAALLRALDLPDDAGRSQVEEVVLRSERFAVEHAVAAAGGIAAALRSPAEWHDEPHADHVANRAPLSIAAGSGVAVRQRPVVSGRPLAGLRVLDLTRVIAGPVCSRTLAAFGADVLRIGAPDLPVVDALLPDSTLGKRFAHADITTESGRQAVLDLAAHADVIVTGFRPGALEDKGLGPEEFLDVNPAVVLAELSAFGADGPWGGRRGFDSITQTATGVAAAEMAAFGSENVRPLPCQLLDHGTGFLLALGVVAALCDEAKTGGQRVSATLLGTRVWLDALGPGSLEADEPLDADRIAACTTARATSFGPIRHVKHPGSIAGVEAAWDRGPSLPGADAPVWL